MNSAHSRPRFRGGELHRESKAKLGPRNGGPRDASVAGCPARGRTEEIIALQPRFHAVARSRAAAEKFLWKGRNLPRGWALVLVERALRPSEFVRPST